MTLLPRTAPVGQGLDLDEDCESLVMHVCAVLGKTGCHFSATRFGQVEWPVDVR